METQANISKGAINPGLISTGVSVLITLIASVVSFLNLVFETLNKRFPDVLNATYQYGYSTYEYEGMRMALATLIIVFPIFLALSYFWNKFSKIEGGRIERGFRKWIIYIILLLSSVVVAADLITLVRYFISGEITTRFIYKIITVLIVAGLVGFYYMSLIKNEEGSKYNTGTIVGGVSIVLAIAAISYSFVIIGSPMKQRSLRMDDRRVSDLQTIQWQVINYWQQKEKLPAKLSDLVDPISGWSLPVDPEFEKGSVYEYAAKGKLEFELCATFSMPIPKGWREYSSGDISPMPYAGYDKSVSMESYPYPGGGANESWDHQEGRTCFTRTIDKDLYPPFLKTR